MINIGDNVKLTGTVSVTGAGTFSVSVKEFYVDEAWHKLNEAKVFDIATDGYNNDFTSLELEYIKGKAESDSKSTTLCDDDMEIVRSIAKKLSNEPS